MSSNRPVWTLTEAAERTGASRSTLRRYRDNGKLPNAYKDSSGVWKFPLEDLLAVGFKPVDPAHLNTVNMVTAHPSEQGVDQGEQPSDELPGRVRELETQLALERARNQGLERVADAAEANARDLRMALRMLESGKGEQSSEQPLTMVTDHPREQGPEQGEQLTPPAPEPPRQVNALTLVATPPLTLVSRSLPRSGCDKSAQ